MTDLPTLAVTGSTGSLGGSVARHLAAQGIPQRLVVRSPGSAPALAGAATVRAEYGDRDAARRALEGVTTLLMVSAAEAPDRLEQHRTFVDAAADAGVEHVVYTSFLGAARDCTFTLGRDHFATEEHIRRRGLTFTFLRDSFYLDFLPLTVGDDGVIRGPAGEGRVSAVARSDIAEAAARVLADPAPHRDTTYDLTGPEALTLSEVASVIGESTGRPVTFHDESVDEAYASRAPWNAPGWQNDAWVSTYTAIRAGEVAGISGDIRLITGHDPMSLRECLARR